MDLVLGEHLHVLPVLRDVDLLRLSRLLVPDDHDLFGGDLLLDDLAVLDHVVVRGDGARDHGLAQAPGGLDDLHVLAGGRVRGEHDSRAVRVHHLLHDHGDVHVLVGELLLHPVVDGPGAVERRPAVLDRLQQIVHAPDVQVGLLLAGEAGFRQVFGRRTGPGRDVDLAAFPLAHRLVVLADLVGDDFGHGLALDQAFGELLRLS